MSLLLRNGQVCSNSERRFKYRSVQARHLFICIQTTPAALYAVKIFAGSSQQISQASVLSTPSSALAVQPERVKRSKVGTSTSQPKIDCNVSVTAVGCIKFCCTVRQWIAGCAVHLLTWHKYKSLKNQMMNTKHFELSWTFMIQRLVFIWTNVPHGICSDLIVAVWVMIMH